ncbi:SIMPL domain-containing protein [bacterium]|nr:MAG: SIMPL domain-containing protein [bacterium]
MNTGNRRGILIAALILGGSWVLGAIIVGKSLVRSRTGDDIIRVVGSARQPIKSDFIIWRGRVSRTAPQMTTVYAAIQGDMAKVEAYLKSKGISDKEIFPQAISTNTLYQQVKTENGYSSDSSTYRPVAGYQMSQDIEVRSSKLELLDDLSRKSSELLSRGVPFESQAPSYLYTKLSDLKVKMQAEAAKDARQRAQGIAEAAGGRLGEVRWARMSAPSLTPLYSGSDNDGGTDDTSSLEKKITAIVTVGYGVN